MTETVEDSPKQPRDRLRLGRRPFLLAGLAAAMTTLVTGARVGAAGGKPRPVIVDTDIGDDIDDTWALLMLLRESRIEVKLAVGDFGNPLYRARLLARLLDETGHSNIPIGIGLTLADKQLDAPGQQSSWLGNYTIDEYPGEVFEDGVQAIIDTIVASPVPVDLLCLGPVPNIAEALRRQPSIARNARFVGMHGSIYKGYAGSTSPTAEYNVRVDPASLQAVFAAPWSITITPLDTCGEVVLSGANYRRLYESDAPWIRILMDNYRAWLPGAPFISPDHDMSITSTTLFDAVAVHLVLGGDLVQMERLPLRVTDDGYTIIDDERGRPVSCAMAWKDRKLFETQLVDGLLPQSAAVSATTVSD